jgi:hypothetical protein
MTMKNADTDKVSTLHDVDSILQSIKHFREIIEGYKCMTTNM